MTLEFLSLAVPVSASLFFSGELIAQWPRQHNLYLSVAVALLLGALLVWHRSRYPADISPPVPDEVAGSEEPEVDEGGTWDLFMVVLLVVGLCVVVVGGLVVSFFVPLVVLLLFSVSVSGADAGDFLLATGCTLGVSFLLEFGVVLPLARLWHLSIDEDRPRRRDFCPPAS